MPKPLSQTNATLLTNVEITREAVKELSRMLDGFEIVAKGDPIGPALSTVLFTKLAEIRRVAGR